ncbi:hypothetical protein [Nocardia rhizosphaerae]|uniref:Uncharacterized protein n=1 Tax=Nocardia rhizosphaerae TaxID=1691571 RepID=A0ABV8L222_9NOCA
MSDRDTLIELIDDTRADGHSPSEAADYLLDAGWRPPAREVDDTWELDALPQGAVVASGDSDVFQRCVGGWFEPGRLEPLDSAELVGHLVGHGPVTVVYVPTEEA